MEERRTMSTFGRWIGFVLLAVVASLAISPGHAAGLYPIANPVSVSVDQSPVSYAGPQPLELLGTSLVPLRGVFESLGATVNFDSNTSTITVDKGDRHIVFQLGSPTATINGQSATLSQPAQIIGGSTMLPLRFVAEAIGDYVDWNPITHMVMIQKPTPSPVQLGMVPSNPPAQTAMIETPPPAQTQTAEAMPLPAPTETAEAAPAPAAPEAPTFFAHRTLSISPWADQAFDADGYVLRVISDTTPMKLDVLLNGNEKIIRLDDDAIVDRGLDLYSEQAGVATDLQRGDHVLFKLNKRGHATLIVATYADQNTNL
jgi:hypothetical protein